MKPLLVISCPLDTFSGYGARARDIVKVLLKSEKYEVKILSQRWGNTPFGFLKSDNPEHKQMLDCILTDPQLPKQPDVWIQLSVPNEFQPVGKFNIGMTAGIETTVCDASWIEGLNRMDLNLVSSNHAKTVFQQSRFEKRNSQTKNIESIVELTKPCEVLFEGVNTNIYKKIEEFQSKDLFDQLNNIEEKFNYLFIGHWLQGEIGQDRKDVGMLIKTFLETFKDKKNKPALIIKTSGAGSSIMDRDEILRKLDLIKSTISGDLPNVYLLHGELDDKDINDLYNHGKVKAMFNLTKGEGFGRPLLEFTMAKKPIIVSGWSGHTDFLNQEYTCLVQGQLTNVHPSAQVPNMILAESKWFSADINQAVHYLKDVYEKYEKYQELAKRQSHLSKTNFSFAEMKKLLNTYLDKIPKQTALQLPQLKKIELPKLKKVD